MQRQGVKTDIQGEHTLVEGGSFRTHGDPSTRQSTPASCTLMRGGRGPPVPGYLAGHSKDVGQGVPAEGLN